MKVVIISCFDTYLERVRLLKEYYLKKGYETLVILSDYSHRNKAYCTTYEDVDIYAHAREYKKNLSIARLYSHYNFSKNVYKELNEIKPDIVHCLIPANSLVKFMKAYKISNPDIKLYFDIIDLWPETMPISKFKNVFPFSLWKNIRDKNLEYGDIIFTECELFQEVLKQERNEKYKTLLWANREIPKPLNTADFKSDEIVYCYLGSINNIIDIDLIIKILLESKKYKKTSIQIIGKGEGKDIFVEKLNSIDVDVIDHGVVFNFEEKQKIFNQCNYGLNIMKSQVCVGLTMKSLDYLCGGLPIVNTISGDTCRLCRNKKIGWNISHENYKEVVRELCLESASDQMSKRNNARNVYLNNFTQKEFERVLENCEKEI